MRKQLGGPEGAASVNTQTPGNNSCTGTQGVVSSDVVPKFGVYCIYLLTKKTHFKT